MNYRADIYDDKGKSAGSRYLNISPSGDTLRDIDAAGDAARRLLQAGQYADLYEHNGTGGATYVDTVHPKGAR